MALQYRLFTVPLLGPDEETAIINHFLRAHRIVSVQKEITRSAEASYCSFIVEYLAEGEKEEPSTKAGKVDFKVVLSPEDFAIFAQLRDARKSVAKERGLPVYAVCTNEQLAAMARERPGESPRLGAASRGIPIRGQLAVV